MAVTGTVAGVVSSTSGEPPMRAMVVRMAAGAAIVAVTSGCAPAVASTVAAAITAAASGWGATTI